MKISDIIIIKTSISCLTGVAYKGDIGRVIRVRSDGTIDFETLRNQFLYKIPSNFVELLH